MGALPFIKKICYNNLCIISLRVPWGWRWGLDLGIVEDVVLLWWKISVFALFIPSCVNCKFFTNFACICHRHYLTHFHIISVSVHICSASLTWITILGARQQWIWWICSRYLVMWCYSLCFNGRLPSLWGKWPSKLVWKGISFFSIVQTYTMVS